MGGTSASEPGLDIFRRQPDGSWKIVRYIAYEEEPRGPRHGCCG
jgi:ketosteroid isomerase-like protein